MTDGVRLSNVISVSNSTISLCHPCGCSTKEQTALGQRGASALARALLQVTGTENYNSEDGHWEFVSGSVVCVKEMLAENDVYLLAVDREDS